MQYNYCTCITNTLYVWTCYCNICYFCNFDTCNYVDLNYWLVRTYAYNVMYDTMGSCNMNYHSSILLPCPNIENNILFNLYCLCLTFHHYLCQFFILYLLLSVPVWLLPNYAIVCHPQFLSQYFIIITRYLAVRQCYHIVSIIMIHVVLRSTFI